jgi:hypothetical protein
VLGFAGQCGPLDEIVAVKLVGCNRRGIVAGDDLVEVV